MNSAWSRNRRSTASGRGLESRCAQVAINAAPQQLDTTSGVVVSCWGDFVGSSGISFPSGTFRAERGHSDHIPDRQTRTGWNYRRIRQKRKVVFRRHRCCNSDSRLASRGAVRCIQNCGRSFDICIQKLASVSSGRENAIEIIVEPQSGLKSIHGENPQGGHFISDALNV